MGSIKCKNCGLTNFSDAHVCKRCNEPFGQKPKAKKEKAPRSFSYVSLIAFAVVAIVIYYAYFGMQTSMHEVDANEANRLASQPKQTEPAGLSRSEYDRQHANQVGSAIQNNNSFSQNQSHNDDIQKAMQASQGSPQR
jgi:hypothetical protein